MRSMAREKPEVRQERRDILEQYPGLRKIGNVANVFRELHVYPFTMASSEPEASAPENDRLRYLQAQTNKTGQIKDTNISKRGNMTLTVRKATPADASTIVDFNLAHADETEDKQTDPEVLAAGVAAALSDPHKAVYFLRTRAEHRWPASSVGVERLAERWLWWFQSVYLPPEWRRRGGCSKLSTRPRLSSRHACDSESSAYVFTSKKKIILPSKLLRLGMVWAPTWFWKSSPLI